MDKFQKIANAVWMQILGAPSCVALEAVGCSMKYSTGIERDIKNKLNLNYKMKNNSGLRQKVKNPKIEKISNYWMKTINKYLRQLRMSWNTLGESKKENIKREAMKEEESQCRKHIKDKHTLEIWGLYKQEIKNKVFTVTLLPQFYSLESDSIAKN